MHVSTLGENTANIMKTKQIWANLSVEDVEQTRDFYSALGFRFNEGGDKGDELASFVVGENDFVVHFFAEEIFQSERGLDGDIADLNNGNEVMFTLSADSQEEVDEWAREVEKAGGTIFSEPQTIMEMTSWYGCGFADPDGHKWNVFYNGE